MVKNLKILSYLNKPLIAPEKRTRTILASGRTTGKRFEIISSQFKSADQVLQKLRQKKKKKSSGMREIGQL